MKKVIINENQRGLLFKNGKYVKMLEAGKYYSYGGKEIEVLNLAQPIVSGKCALEVILSDRAVANNVSVIEVADEELALHFVNGKFASVLRRGKYAFWSQIDKHEYKICHMPLNMMIRDPKLLNNEECRYAMNSATHLDFLIYNRISKKPVLAVEVDGYHYHKDGTAQAARDKMKNHILDLYEIPYLRFATNGSGEKEKIIKKLTELLKR